MVSGCFQRISIIITLLITIATLGNNTPSLELRRLRLGDTERLSRDHTEPGLARRSFDLNPPLFLHPMGGPVPSFQAEKLRTGAGRGTRCPEALKKPFLQCSAVIQLCRTRHFRIGAGRWLTTEAIFKFKNSRRFQEGWMMDLRPFLGL